MIDNRPDLLEKAKRDEWLWEPILADLGFVNFSTEPLDSKLDLRECTDIIANRDIKGKEYKFGFSSRIRNIDRYSLNQLKRYQLEFTFRSKRPQTGSETEEDKLFTIDNPPHFFLYGWYSYKIQKWISWLMLSVERLKYRYDQGHFDKYNTREVGSNFVNNRVEFKPIPILHFRECIMAYSYKHPSVPDRWGILPWEEHDFKKELHKDISDHAVCRYCGCTDLQKIVHEWGKWQCLNELSCAIRIRGKLVESLNKQE